MNRRKQGFTMIEMLVVLGIIAILAAALIVSMGRVTRTAQRSKAQEVVSNAATALTSILQTRMNWPKLLVNKSGQRLDQNVAKLFAKMDLMGVSTVSAEKGADRCGIVDPWAQTVLKKSGSSSGTVVPSGGTVADHVLYFAIDKDADGIVTTGEGAPVDVRASAVVWASGADGKLGTYGSRTKEGLDDVFSWAKGQEVK